MAKVIWTLGNGSELINGVKFVTHKLGMISEEIEKDVADVFLSIKGYVPAGKNAEKDAAAAQAPLIPAADSTATAKGAPATDATEQQPAA
ncbi:MAG TPA: hypothetical protein VF534_01575 [Paraburkholderia sp.]